ncbi:carboxymuconolactone decarboxylase family protein [Kribbella sancticallisti]|uniref:carboxymuconolactone decarboxylase family protein n=1 Tax=Kribbella sancticallisti TaxID=460087 RepID=UPI0031E3BB7B
MTSPPALGRSLTRLARGSGSSRPSSPPSRRTRPFTRPSRPCKPPWAAVLDAKTRHSIALAVSQANDCDYCLAIHTYVSSEFGGMSNDDIDLSRAGTSVDPKRAAAAHFAQLQTDIDIPAATSAGMPG